MTTDNTGLERLSLNTKTTNTWTLQQAIDGAARTGIPALGLWRDRVQEVGVEKAAKLVRDAGLRVSSLCRGGFLTAADDAGIAAALEDNKRAVDEAATLGTDALVMVVGGLPQDGQAQRSLDLAGARERVAERLAELAPYALDHGVKLVLEALHPMYVADRAVISTLGQALDLAAPHPTDAVAVVVDTFHVFWDPDLATQVRRAGDEGRLAAYQVCDFNLPIPSDALLARGMMGDGVIDFAPITRMVAETGYAGDVEVEIFNEAVWASDPDEVLATMAQRYRDLVLPHLT